MGAGPRRATGRLHGRAGEEARKSLILKGLQCRVSVIAAPTSYKGRRGIEMAKRKGKPVERSKQASAETLNNVTIAYTNKQKIPFLIDASDWEIVQNFSWYHSGEWVPRYVT